MREIKAPEFHLCSHPALYSELIKFVSSEHMARQIFPYAYLILLIREGRL